MVKVCIKSKETNEVEIAILDYNIGGATGESLAALKNLAARSKNSSLFEISIHQIFEVDNKKFYNDSVLHKGLQYVDPFDIYSNGDRLSTAMIDVIINECANNENYCVHFYNTLKEQVDENAFTTRRDFEAFCDFINVVMMKVTADIEDRLASLSRIKEDIRHLKEDGGSI